MPIDFGDPVRARCARPIATCLGTSRRCAAAVNNAKDVKRTGPSLVRALEGIRARHRLNPIEADSASAGHDDIIRIVCSDGLV
jgi:hypothetical protein